MGILNLYDVYTENGQCLRHIYTLLPSLQHKSGIAIDGDYIMHYLIHKTYDNNGIILDLTRSLFISNVLQFINSISKFDVYQIWVFDGYNKKKAYVKDKRKANINYTMQRHAKRTIEAFAANSDIEVQMSAMSLEQMPPSSPSSSPPSSPSTATTSSMDVEYNGTIYTINKNVPTRQDKQTIIKVLTSIGIPHVIANNLEAEQLAAMLCKEMNLLGVISSDTDVLMFNANLINPTTDGYKLRNIDEYLTLLNLNYENFVKMCVCLGCDFCEKYPRVGPKTILTKLHSLQLNDTQQQIVNDILTATHNIQIPNCPIVDFNAIFIFVQEYIDELYVRIPNNVAHTFIAPPHISISFIHCGDNVLINEERFTNTIYTANNAPTVLNIINSSQFSLIYVFKIHDFFQPIYNAI